MFYAFPKAEDGQRVSCQCIRVCPDLVFEVKGVVWDQMCELTRLTGTSV